MISKKIQVRRVIALILLDSSQWVLITVFSYPSTFSDIFLILNFNGYGGLYLSYVEVPSLHTLPNTWDVADVMTNHSSISPYS